MRLLYFSTVMLVFYTKLMLIQKATSYKKNSDYTKLINHNNFQFKIINFPCNNRVGSNMKASNLIYILIIIHSAIDHFVHREVIRETWGQEAPLIKRLFVLGKASSRELQNKIYEENDRYRDIIQANFLDTYHNLTYKHMTVMKYVLYHCPNTQYILKTDDDIFVNVPLLIHFLTKTIYPLEVNNLISCFCFELTVPRSGLHGVSYEEFPGPEYPPYCSGAFIIYSQDVIDKLYQAAQISKFFWIDDVHFTGILAERVGIKRSFLTPSATLNINAIEFLLEHANKMLLDSNYMNFLVIFNPYNSIPDKAKFRLLWNILNETKA